MEKTKKLKMIQEKPEGSIKDQKNLSKPNKNKTYDRATVFQMRVCLEVVKDTTEKVIDKIKNNSELSDKQINDYKKAVSLLNKAIKSSYISNKLNKAFGH